jgi:hypothetical protein
MTLPDSRQEVTPDMVVTMVVSRISKSCIVLGMVWALESLALRRCIYIKGCLCNFRLHRSFSSICFVTHSEYLTARIVR